MSTEHDAAAGSGWARLLVVLVARAYRAMLLTLAAAAALPLLLSWGSYVVESGSMEPSIAVGDVVLARPTAEDHKVRVGRVYVFDDPQPTGRLVVHRVVERRDDGDFTTAGDANDVTDLTPLEASGIRAQALLLVPYVGLPVHWARTSEWLRLGAWLLVTMAAFAIATTRLDDERPARRRRRQAATAAALAVGVVAAGTSGAANATFTARTLSSGSLWTAGAWVQPYVGAVLTDRPFGFWLLDEAAGTPYAQDRSGNDRTAEYFSPVGLGRPGALPGNPGTSVGIQGGRVILGSGQVPAPSEYSIEIWFRTTSTTGGYIAGFEDDRDELAWKAVSDRLVHMDTTGRLVFGLWDTYKQSITSPRAYNDGAWHHLVVTSTSARSSTMYVDGLAVAGGTTSPVQSYLGYWRIGQGTIGPGNSYTTSFPGDLDNVAIYHSVLSPGRVAAHWDAR